MIYILSFCNSSVGYRIMGFLGIIISIIKICVPIILILIGTIDLVKCILYNKDKTNKIIKNLVQKFILAIVVFFVPTIVMTTMNLLGENYNGKICMTCLLDTPTNCIKIGNNMNTTNNVKGLCSVHHDNQKDCISPCKYVNGLCRKGE